MSLEHLTVGSKCPPLIPGKLRIYAMRFCPYCQRALLTATAKNAPIDVVYINLKDKPEWLLGKSPGGKVPCVERSDGEILCESLIVADYFDEAYTSGTPLHPKDPFEKASNRIIVENFGKLGPAFYKMAYVADTPSSDIPKLAEEYEEVITSISKELEKKGTKFFGGNEKPGMTDYMIWPWFERRFVLELQYPDANFQNLRKNSEAIEQWVKNMLEDHAVKQFYLSPQIHFEYNQTVRSGNPNFNMLFKK